MTTTLWGGVFPEQKLLECQRSPEKATRALGSALNRSPSGVVERPAARESAPGVPSHAVIRTQSPKLTSQTRHRSKATRSFPALRVLFAPSLASLKFLGKPRPFRLIGRFRAWRPAVGMAPWTVRNDLARANRTFNGPVGSSLAPPGSLSHQRRQCVCLRQFQGTHAHGRRNPDLKKCGKHFQESQGPPIFPAPACNSAGHRAAGGVTWKRLAPG